MRCAHSTAHPGEGREKHRTRTWSEERWDNQCAAGILWWWDDEDGVTRSYGGGGDGVIVIIRQLGGGCLVWAS